MLNIDRKYIYNCQQRYLQEDIDENTNISLTALLLQQWVHIHHLPANTKREKRNLNYHKVIISNMRKIIFGLEWPVYYIKEIC